MRYIISPSPAPRRTAGEGGERSETGEGLAAVLTRPKYRYKKL